MQVLPQSLAYICAYETDQLIGFANVAWDGHLHAFLLDPTVHTAYQRQGIGTELVRQATEFAQSKKVEWLHVDFDPHLATFYAGCGFVHTDAGLIHLNK